ncbi:MAG: hypothetical protein IJ638_01400 [Alphaproteobacteria bacterium]|nr:hypothetical protein [Alphaproteobacteria bacterium]
MKVVEKEDIIPYRTRNGKKKKSQRVNMTRYNVLLAELESLGVVSVTFDKNFSYEKRIRILKEILSQQK